MHPVSTKLVKLVILLIYVTYLVTLQWSPAALNAEFNAIHLSQEPSILSSNSTFIETPFKCFSVFTISSVFDPSRFCDIDTVNRRSPLRDLMSIQEARKTENQILICPYGSNIKRCADWISSQCWEGIDARKIWIISHCVKTNLFD
jgi:hypothetical protein